MTFCVAGTPSPRYSGHAPWTRTQGRSSHDVSVRFHTVWNSVVNFPSHPNCRLSCQNVIFPSAVILVVLPISGECVEGVPPTHQCCCCCCCCCCWCCCYCYWYCCCCCRCVRLYFLSALHCLHLTSLRRTHHRLFTHSVFLLSSPLSLYLVLHPSSLLICMHDSRMQHPMVDAHNRSWQPVATFGYVRVRHKQCVLSVVDDRRALVSY
jgi:hypothetical protein